MWDCGRDCRTINVWKLATGFGYGNMRLTVPIYLEGDMSEDPALDGYIGGADIVNMYGKRIKELEEIFRHYHVNAQDETDTCKECGLDLRDPIHIRENK